MNTPSHFLITASIDRAFPRIPILKQAFLLGSIAPDLPLWLLSIGGIIYYRFGLGWSTTATAQRLFDELYFQHWAWIASHNFLHSPVILLIGIAWVWRSRRNIGSRSRWMFWFLIACLLHTAIDILTHVDDGPLLLFPFNWTLRFRSSVSYWDDRYYGREFQQFEQILDGVLLLYLLTPCFYRQIRKIRQNFSHHN
jgi:membrane-bound metal-dependent hydrolase YbcI (DUF457 family)